jgi:hypothetical protein
MADASGFRRSVILVLLLALLVASLDVARLLTVGHHAPSQRTAPPIPPSTSTIPSTAEPPPTTGAAGGSSTSVSGNATGSGLTGGAAGPQLDAVPPTALKSPAPVICNSDLRLAESPDAPYNFFCLQGGVPLTWRNDDIRLYTTGLTPEQTSALQVALPQWEARGRFTVTMAASADNANLTISPGVLENSEDGYAAVHYACEAICAFDHVDVQLSSTRKLTKPLWITTILHELGHAAGLNHVRRSTQIMYPELGLRSPVAYGAGDVAGLQELARRRAS